MNEDHAEQLLTAGGDSISIAAFPYSMRIEASVYFFALMQKSNKKDQGCGEILAGKCREALLVKELARTRARIELRAGLKQLFPASGFAGVSASRHFPANFSKAVRTRKERVVV